MSSDENKSAQLHPQLTAIQQQLQTLLNTESAAKKSFQGLYQELEDYKNDFLFRHERVLLQDLLLFYDSLLWFVEEIKANPEKSADYAQYLIDEFLEVLRRRDVLPVEPQERFDRKLHRIINTEATANAQEDKQIVEIHRRGFHRGEQLIRAEEVVIYRFDASLSSPSQDLEEEDLSSSEEDDASSLPTAPDTASSDTESSAEDVPSPSPKETKIAASPEDDVKAVTISLNSGNQNDGSPTTDDEP